MFSFIKKIIIGIISYFKDKRTVSHIRLNGVIGNVGKFKQGIDFSSQQEIIKKAFSVEKIEAVAISINSPGGSPVQSHLIYSYVKKMAKKKNIKVLVFAEDVAASGGYLIACAGDEIYANSSSIVGSIGVIYAAFGLQDLIKKAGIQRRIYTAGKNKSTLDPFVEEKKEDIDRLKKIQLDLHSDFIKVVEDSRSTKLKKDKNFLEYYYHVTPQKILEHLFIGSRPTKRKKSQGIKNLRAIPWVFAWTQIRFILPAWLGTLEALNIAKKGKNKIILKDMLKHWPFFYAMMDMLDMVLTKTDQRVIKFYEECLADKSLKKIGEKLRKQLSSLIYLNKKIIPNYILEQRKEFRESIRIRNTYAEVLNLLQAGMKTHYVEILQLMQFI